MNSQLFSMGRLKRILVVRGLFNVSYLSEQVLQVINDRNDLLTVKCLSKISGIGSAKASLICASLEFARRRIRPEGVKICSAEDIIAAGAGTIYRNYFAVVNGQIGQSSYNQIDCLSDIGVALGNSENRLWEMRNGYVVASHEGLIELSSRLQASSERELDEVRQLLRIGVQWDTQVTLNDSSHTISQAYCSALPVAYSPHSSELWSEFARLILEASYEATICTAVLNSMRNGNNRLYLTLLGGGAFGNTTEWIMEGMQRALNLYKHVDLDVAIVSYGSSRQDVRQIVNQFI